MKKLLTVIFSLFLISPAIAEVTADEIFIASIHICKNKNLYKQEKEGIMYKDVLIEWEVINCFCDNFKEYTEAEIFQKYEDAMDYGIPQYDMYISMKKAQDCVKTLNNK